MEKWEKERNKGNKEEEERKENECPLRPRGARNASRQKCFSLKRRSNVNYEKRASIKHTYIPHTQEYIG